MLFGSKKSAAGNKAAAEKSNPTQPAQSSLAAAIPDVRAAAPTSPTPPGSPAAPAGSAPAPAQTAMSEEARQRAATALRLSAAFAQIVTVLLRSPQHKHLALADLEWLVFPPLATGQFAVANVQAKENGASVPAAVVLWASVSAETDKRLSENRVAPMRLRPDEWKSGDILWLIEAVGDARLVPALLKQLQENAFKDRDVKMRTRGPDGKAEQKTLRAYIDSNSSN